MRSAEGRIAVGLLVLAFALRAWNAGDPPFPVLDEQFHPQDARDFVETGQASNTSWPYPPMKHFLLLASMKVFGDDARGWRLRNVVFGSATAALVALLGAALFPDRRRVGGIAGLLVAVDPLQVSLSRTTEEEILVAAFFLAATWAVVLHLRDGRDTVPAATLSLGAAFATKPYYLAASALLAVLVLVAAARSPAPRSAVAGALAWLTLVPAAIYVAAFLPWFHRGYGLGEFVRFQLDAAREILDRSTKAWSDQAFLVGSGTAGSWFTTLRTGAARACAPGGAPCRMFAVVRNYPVWLAVLPAAAVVSVHGVRSRDGRDLLAAGLFAAAYLPLLLVSRPVFFYSSATVFPFAALLVARLADLGAERRPRTVAAAMAIAVLVAAYFYPIATLRDVPAWYAPHSALVAAP